MLRCFDYSLISYPLSVRLCSTAADEQADLLANTALLAVRLGLALVMLLALGIELLGGGDILLAAAVCYLCWQAQETMRRCLLANFRYRAAVAGDAVSFIGQAVLIGVLAWMEVLTLVSALYTMSATFLAGALVHASKLHFGRPNLTKAAALARDYFAHRQMVVALLRDTDLAPAIVPLGAGGNRRNGGHGDVPGRLPISPT